MPEAAKKYSDGLTLPPSLDNQFGVSRSTIREAVRIGRAGTQFVLT